MNNENIMKRAELHFHTKFSKNHHSSIEVSKAIEKAKELNLSSIAFCDYKSVDAFTDITDIKNENKSDIKIIYGAELPFMTTSQTIKTKGYSLTLLAKNQDGITALQELATTLTPDKKYSACELLDLELLNRNKQNLLIGSTGDHGEIFFETKWWWEFPKDYKKMAEFYDFFEIYPPRNQEDKKVIEMVLELSRAFHVPIVATSCALSLSALDEEKRLEEMKIKFPYYKSENHFLRSTDEVLKEFSFLGEDIAYDIVIKNPTLIADRIETY